MKRPCRKYTDRPVTMPMLTSEPNRPRRLGGLVSTMNKLQAFMIFAAATPWKNFAATIVGKFNARLQLVHTIIPILAPMIVRRRPYSTIQPDSHEPTTMPAMTELVTIVVKRIGKSALNCTVRI